VKPAEQQQAVFIRQWFAIGSPQQNGTQSGGRFFDSQRAHSNRQIRQFPFRRDGVKVVFDRTDIRRAFASPRIASSSSFLMRCSAN
jgi:hypothetical protein